MARRKHQIGREAARSVLEARKSLRGIRSPIDQAHASQDVVAALQDGIVEVSTIRRAAIRQLYEDGWTINDLATEFSITRARAHQIVNA